MRLLTDGECVFVAPFPLAGDGVFVFFLLAGDGVFDATLLFL